MNKLKSILKYDSYNKYFFATFFILWCFYILKYPTLSYNSEVWAEQGTNYLYHAYNSNLWDNIWMPDAGYLVWLPRFIALIVSYIFSPFYFIYITSFIGLAVIAYCISFINHESFRDIVGSDKERFVLSMVLGVFIIPYYENFTFVNFAYHGFIFCSLLIFMDKEKLDTREYWIYSILSALFCISKFHYVVFLPVLLGAIAIHYYQKEKKSILFFVPSIITILIQVIYVLQISSKSSSVKSDTIIDESIFSVILTSLKGVYFWLQAYAVNFDFIGNALLVNLFSLFVILFLILLLVKKWFKQELPYKTILLLITFNIIAVGYSSISSLSHLKDLNVNFSNTEFYFNRINFMTYDLVWIAGMIFLFNLKHKITKNTLLVIFMFLSISITLNKGTSQYKWPDIKFSYSEWANYYKLFNKEQYCIPVNPDSRIILKNCSKINENKNNKPISKIKFGKASRTVLSLLVTYPYKEEVYAVAYDIDGSKIGEAKMLSNENRIFKYLLFDNAVIPYKIMIFKKHNDKIAKIYGVTIYGN